MKIKGFPFLILLTGVFAAFILGFFAGRNLNRTPVQIRALPSPTAEATVSETQPPETEPWPLDINAATLEQLQKLPGIGEVLAQRIIDYREANGAFQSIGELGKVDGIGEKKLEAIWDLVTTGG